MAGRRYLEYYAVPRGAVEHPLRGLAAQRRAVAGVLRKNANVLGAYTDIRATSGDRRLPELVKAIDRCKRIGAILVVANFGALRRNPQFLNALRDSKVEFIAADLPSLDRAALGNLALEAERHSQTISRRTREGLVAALPRLRAAGRRLGNPQGAEPLRRAAKGNKAALRAIRAKANGLVRELCPTLHLLEAEGVTSLRRIATALNEQGFKSARGNGWRASSVRNLLRRHEEECPRLLARLANRW